MDVLDYVDVILGRRAWHLGEPYSVHESRAWQQGYMEANDRYQRDLGKDYEDFVKT